MPQSVVAKNKEDRKPPVEAGNGDSGYAALELLATLDGAASPAAPAAPSSPTSTTVSVSESSGALPSTTQTTPGPDSVDEEDGWHEELQVSPAFAAALPQMVEELWGEFCQWLAERGDLDLSDDDLEDEDDDISHESRDNGDQGGSRSNEQSTRNSQNQDPPGSSNNQSPQPPRLPVSNDGNSNAATRDHRILRRRRDTAAAGQLPWACPLWKMDPARFNGCENKILRRISDVKHHLHKKHEWRCNRCGKGWKEIRPLELHDGKSRCERQVMEEWSWWWLHQDHARGIRRPMRAGTNATHGWFEIWDCLFPGGQRPMTPFNDGCPVSIAQFTAFLRACGDNRAVEIADSRRVIAVADEEQRERDLQALYNRTMQRILQQDGHDGSSFYEFDSYFGGGQQIPQVPDQTEEDLNEVVDAPDMGGLGLVHDDLQDIDLFLHDMEEDGFNWTHDDLTRGLTSHGDGPPM